jgi:hypothetical protein
VIAALFQAIGFAADFETVPFGLESTSGRPSQAPESKPRKHIESAREEAEYWLLDS